MSTIVQPPAQFAQKALCRDFMLDPTQGWSASRWIEIFYARNIDLDPDLVYYIRRELVPTTGVRHKVSLISFDDPNGGRVLYNDVRDAQFKHNCVAPVPIEALLQVRLYKYGDLFERFNTWHLSVFYGAQFPFRKWTQIHIGDHAGRDVLHMIESPKPFGCISGPIRVLSGR